MTMKTQMILLLAGSVLLAPASSRGQGTDFGDAPAAFYPTLLPGGARHGLSNLYLGASMDAKSNGQPVDRDGDDEAGVGIPPLVIGSTVDLIITASTNGFVDAWLDFDGTPGWSAGEQVFTNLAVAAGTHAYALTIPVGAVAGTTWFRCRVSSAGGLGPGGPAADGEVEDFRVNLLRPLSPNPILIMLDYHADPLGGPVPTQAVTFSNWVSASHWLLDQAEPRGAKLSFLTVGGFAEWARAVPDLGYPLMQRLHSSGAQLGTHSHTEYRADPHDWTNLPPAPSLSQLTNAWNDHLNMVDALVAESLGFTAPADIRRINFVRGSHAPTNNQLRLDFMATSGYTQHEQGPDEQFYGYFGHYAMNPYRPHGDNFLEHDPAGPVVLAPFGPVLGANAVHFGIVQDMRQPAVKARMLMEVLNWLHDRKVAGRERIWVNGGTLGHFPTGALLLHHDWLYGTTSDYERDATGDYGTIFRVRLDGSGLQTVHRFGLGGHPYDRLVPGPDGWLYGTTHGAFSNPNEHGAVFRLDPESGTVTTVIDFDRLGTRQGSKPNGSVAFSADGRFLFATTHGNIPRGGNRPGTLFAFDLALRRLHILHVFDGGLAGDVPMRTPVLFGNRLCGMAAWGGLAGDSYPSGNGLAYAYPLPDLTSPPGIEIP
jgi:uncharacterized repeat protein (TIGR03803 family)